MNILILSPGRRVEIVNYFKSEIKKSDGKVVTLDMNPYTVALYSGDKQYCIEKDFDNTGLYMKQILHVCDQEKINAVLTLIDPELPLLASYREELLEIGVFPIVSNKELVDFTLDKYLFYEKFRDIVPLVQTWKDKESLIEAIEKNIVSFPIFTKPRKGSGSIGLTTIMNLDELKNFKSTEEYIYQPYLKKKEYGIDAYFDLISGHITNYFIKEKVGMRCGETDKSISVYDEKIVSLLQKLNGQGFIGPVDIDVFKDFKDEYYINEINPRFGGGYPHAYYCGVNFIKSLINNLNGKKTGCQFGEYEEGIVMMKYNNLFFTKKSSIISKGL